MLKSNKSIIIACLFSLLTFSSLAQKVPEKYIVFIFEDTRNYKDYHGKRLSFCEYYYWIAKCDTLFKNHSVSQLYIPSNDGSITVSGDGEVYLSNFMSLNGSNKDENHYSDSPFIQWINKQKKRKTQSIKIVYALNNQDAIKRKKETVNIYYLPVVGCFSQGKMLTKDKEWLTMYYPDSVNSFEVADLTEREKEFLRFLDCSVLDFSSNTYNYDVFHKGFCILKNRSQ